ncbi:DUF935 domain-containing protein [Serratia nevei]|uniref:DUF935 domain-containing protein n=1 Tax=Serratia nevei TaxID=2703794 RepID=UPI00285AB1FF|nr:DUF935 family protein [Serratia nevei]MDR8533009.1 DUF935 family protein [Serratia nevei]
MAESRIVDITGQPFRFDEGMQTQREELSMVANRYQEHPSSGITPNRAAVILRDAERGDLASQADLATDIEEKDTHIFSELGKRRLAIQSVPWSIEPPPNASSAEKKDAEMLDEYLRDAAWFEDGLFDASDAILKGYAMQEIEWGWLGKFRCPKALHWRDPALFCSTPNNLNELRLRDNSYEGQTLQPFGWVRHQAKSKSGYAGTLGLVRTLIWPFIFKNYSVRDFAEFLEVYGLPMRVGKFPSGASSREKATLMQAVMDIGRRAGGIIPMGMQLEFQSAASGQADPFQAMISWAERSASKAILGGTLTSQTDTTGARSLGEVHNEVRKEIRNADLTQLARTVTRDLIFPLQALNAATALDPRRLPRLTFDTTEPEDIASYADAIPKLAVGMDIPTAWIHDKLRIPQAQSGEQVFRIQPQSELPPLPVSGRAALSATDLPGEPPAKDDMDKLADSVSAQQLQAAIDPVLKPVIDAIIAEGPEAAMQRAASLYSEMDDSELIELMTRALFVADLWGQLDATDR